MAKNFHNKPFDDETILKLQIFRGYTREWLPVFLSKKSRYNNINIFDFFAGPGKDSNSLDGSPLIIIGEINKYVASPNLSMDTNVPIKLFFNDSNLNKVLLLKKELAQKNTERVFSLVITNQKFHQCFEANRAILSSPSEAKLAIIDQSGVKQITPVIFKQLVDFPTTDFMFFISSSFLKRFISVEEMGQYFPDMSPEEIRSIRSTDVHRFICQYYKKLVHSQKDFNLAPFSIKKGANIYGIIFGTSNLLGLEKFLKVCWDNDKISGEANYDIDNDIVRSGQRLFKEMNISRKIDLFKVKLIEFLQNCFISNNELYKFTLEYGCLPKHTNEILRELQKNGRIQSQPSDIRKGSFYINWENYRKQNVKAAFSMKA